MMKKAKEAQANMAAMQELKKANNEKAAKAKVAEAELMDQLDFVMQQKRALEGKVADAKNGVETAKGEQDKAQFDADEVEKKLKKATADITESC